MLSLYSTMNVNLGPLSVKLPKVLKLGPEKRRTDYLHHISYKRTYVHHSAIYAVLAK